MTRKTQFATAALLAVASAGAVVAQAGDGVERRQSPEQARAGHTEPRVQQVDGDQQSAFRIFRRPARAEDRIPSAARSQLQGSAFGQNPALARAIDTPSGTGWVIPGRDELCLAVPDVGEMTLSCNSTASARQGSAVSTLTRPDTSNVKLFALLPDGTREISVSFGDGSSRALQTDEDGVLSEALNDPRQLSFTTSDGQRRTHDVSPVTQGSITVDCGDGRYAEADGPAEVRTACDR